MSDQTPDELAPEPETGAPDAPGQVAFDVDAFPGGARSAIEAVLMVVDEPVSEVVLATALELPVATVRSHLESLEAEYAAAHRGFTLRPFGGG